MSKRMLTTRSLCLGAVIAALYAALTWFLAPISYGPVQCRLSEALTLLPVLVPQAIPGLTVGCLIANVAGLASGLTTIWDVIFGTLATLLAAVATWATRNMTVSKARLPIVSALWPVVANGIIVGLVLTLTLNLPFVLTALEVAAGEIVATALGVVMIWALRKTSFDFDKLARG